MAESFKSKRLGFPKGSQRNFLVEAKSQLKLSDIEMAILLKISLRTLTDWKREKFTIALPAAKLLSKKAKLKFPTGTQVLSPFWSVKKAAKLGAKATIKKYGKICQDEKKREAGWRQWWETKGRFLKRIPTHPLKVYLPRKSAKLAEFVGILIGDGGISDFQITVTLNRFSDKKYSNFVCNLIKVLFRLKASKNYRQSVVNLQISRKNLVKFLIKLGLKKGNKIKQKVDIPLWIKKNNKFSIACIRGLVDTDGCFYKHGYRVNKKLYIYHKIDFASRSDVLIKSVKLILENLGLHPGIDRRGDIRIYRNDDVKKYLEIISSHNPKHRNKFNGGVRRIGKPAVC